VKISVAIRPYREADFDAITWLCLQSWKSNGVETPVFESAITHLRRKFRPEFEKGAMHVATMGHRIVGFILFQGNEIADLFIAPAVQRQGIGKRLLDFAKAKHPDGLWLTTLVPNTRARRFYEREGLTLRVVKIGRRPGYRICWYDWRPGTPSRPRAFSASLRKQLSASGPPPRSR
jgi:ribosomal protein S18 acetylase RimI-like enzyme